LTPEFLLRHASALMILTPITISCPQCGSTDVVYSCKPECCFNHVCNHCYTTFELETSRVGEVKEEFRVPPDPDPSAPTTACARCGDVKVFAIRAGQTSAPQYVCASCKALLTLGLTGISPG
jgi:transposase-like protein